MESLRDDEQAQMAGRMGAIVALMVALFVGVLVAAFLAPVAIDAMESDGSESFTDVSSGESVEFADGWNVTLDNVDDTDNEIDVTVNNTDGGSESITGLSVGDNATVIVDGEEITVTADSIDSASSASFTVDYPTDLTWSGGASSLWSVTVIAIVLALFLAFIGLAMRASRMV